MRLTIGVLTAFVLSVGSAQAATTASLPATAPSAASRPATMPPTASSRPAMPSSVTSRPASRPASMPATMAASQSGTDDPLTGAIDPYEEGSARQRFFSAAGVDSELSSQEFQQDCSKAGGFGRSFDKWEALIHFDRNGNKTIDWFEAAAYRSQLRQRVLKACDADQDGKLTGAERANAIKALQAVLLAMSQQRPTSASAGKAAPAPQEAHAQEYDFDGDGQLNAEERQAMQEEWASKEAPQAGAQPQSAPADNKADAKAQRERSRRGMMERDDHMMKHFDLDGDGTLSDDEMAAVDAFGKKFERIGKGLELRVMDADGDGTVSDGERKAFQIAAAAAFAGVQSRLNAAMDTDGDGTASPQEQRAFGERAKAGMQKYMEKIVQRVDLDGDGRLLSDVERDAAIDAFDQDIRARLDRAASTDGKVAPAAIVELYAQFAKEELDIDIPPAAATADQ